jgi:prepilin-type N-terminal cleavage/methylation domain-containing protein
MKRFKIRRGYSLIELLLVMSVAVVIMLVNVGWIHQTMKFSSLMDQRQQHHQNLTRLAWELRDDVHHSNSLAMDGDDRLVLARNDGTSVTYTISAASLDLTRRRDNTIQRETFGLTSNSQVYWDTSELPDWISLIVARGPEGLAKRRSGESELRYEARDSTAVDLHVRVSPNRWNTTPVEKVADEESKEESK